MKPFQMSNQRTHSPDRLSTQQRKEKRSRTFKKSRHHDAENDPFQAQEVDDQNLSWPSNVSDTPRLDLWASTPQPVSTAALFHEGLSTQQKVDAFLLSLPLGITAQDAAIESAVADRLTILYEEVVSLKQSLDQWMSAATELKEAVNDQQNEIEYMRKRDSIISNMQTPQKTNSLLQSSESNGHSIAFYQQEIAELKDMVASLRTDLLSRDQAASDRIMPPGDEVMRARDDLRQMQALHESTLREQANFHQQELEDLHFEMQNLEAVIQDQNLKLDAHEKVHEQADKLAVKVETEQQQFDEEKEFLMLQIDELTEENRRLQQNLRESKQSLLNLRDSQRSDTTKSTRRSRTSYGSPAQKSPLKQKAQQILGDSETSLNDWALEAVWPEQVSPLPESKEEGLAQTPCNASEIACPASLYSEAPEEGKPQGRCELVRGLSISAVSLKAASFDGPDGQSPSQIDDDVLRAESDMDTPEPKADAQSDSDTPEHLRQATRKQQTPSTSASDQLARTFRPVFDLSPPVNLCSTADCRDRDTPTQEPRDTQETGCQTDMQESSLEPHAHTQEALEAQIAELETQLHDSGRKFTAELSSVIEMHERQIQESDANHHAEISKAQSDMDRIQSVHQLEIQQIGARKEFERNQLAEEVARLKTALDSLQQAKEEAHSTHLEEVCDLQAQLEMQKGLESAVAQDLAQINAVFSEQADDLHQAQTALAESLKAVKSLREQCKEVEQREAAGLKQHVREDAMGLAATDGSVRETDLHHQIAELENMLARQSEDSQLHAQEMIELHKAHQTRVTAMQITAKDQQLQIEGLETALEEEGIRAEKAENALMDCQEMLEELQAYSEQQALSSFHQPQDQEWRTEDDVIQLRASQCSLALESEDLREKIKQLQLQCTEADSARQEAVSQVHRLQAELQAQTTELIAAKDAQDLSRDLKQRTEQLLIELASTKKSLSERENALAMINNNLEEVELKSKDQQRQTEDLQQLLAKQEVQLTEQASQNLSLADSSTMDANKIASLEAQLEDSNQGKAKLETEVLELRQQIVQLEADLEAAVQQSHHLREEAKEALTVDNQNKAELQAVKLENADLTSKQEAMHIELVAAAASRKVHEHEARHLEDEIHGLHKSQADLRATMQQLKLDQAAAVEGRILIEEQLAGCALELKACQEQNKHLEEICAQDTATLQQLRADFSQEQQKTTALQKDLESANAHECNKTPSQEGWKDELCALQERLESLVEEKVKLEADRLEALTVADQLRSRLAQSEMTQTQLKSEALQSTARQSDLEKQLQSLETTKHCLSAKIQDLEAEIAALAGKEMSKALEIQSVKLDRSDAQSKLEAQEQLQTSKLPCENNKLLANNAESVGAEESYMDSTKSVPHPAAQQAIMHLSPSSSIRARVRKSLEASDKTTHSPPIAERAVMSESKAEREPSTPMNPPSRLGSLHSTKTYRSLTALSTEAVRELHFNPVFGETVIPRKLILPGLVPPLQLPGSHPSRIGRTKATSPNKWIRSHRSDGSPRWQPKIAADSASHAS